MKNTQELVLVLLRVALGILFLWSGLDKLTSGFTAADYLGNAVSGPLMNTYKALAGSPVVDFLVVYGQIGIGLSLIFGVLLRFGAVMGTLMMLLFYFSSFPPEHGLVSEHVIYSFVFLLLGVHGTGCILGIDKYLESTEIVKKNYKTLRYLLG